MALETAYKRLVHVAESLDAVVVEEAIGAGEHARADLDDEETGDVGDVLAERVGHGARVVGAVPSRQTLHPTRGRKTGPSGFPAPSATGPAAFLPPCRGAVGDD